MKAVAPTPGAKYRIKVGQTIGGLCWSNAATTIQGFWTIVYDNGDPDYWPIVQSASGSSRAAVNWSTGQVAKKNGWVVGGLVGGGGSFQRGQLYHQAFIVDTNLTVVSDVIACGYAYAGHVVEFGTFVEPGPAGGHGMMTTTVTDNPAAGVQHASVAVPTGVIWKLRGYRETVTAFTAAAKSITVTSSGTPAQTIARSINFTPAAAAGAIHFVLNGPNTLDTVLNGIIVSIPPDLELIGGDTIGITLNGIAGGDDLAAGNVSLEEWVMPN